MKHFTLARLAAALWPYLRPYVIALLEQERGAAQATPHIGVSERLLRRYIGDP
jgi:hypothetical protein